jgi:Flp pilus assembly pilin Flp
VISDRSAVVEREEGTKRKREERGVSLVEYALLVGLISITVLASIFLLSSSVSETFSEVAEPLS